MFYPPSDDPSSQPLNLHDYLVKNHSATFFMRVAQDQPSLCLYRNDLLVVDRTIEPKEGSIVVSEGKNGKLEATKYSNTKTKTVIWGTVTSTIRQTCTFS